MKKKAYWLRDNPTDQQIKEYEEFLKKEERSYHIKRFFRNNWIALLSMVFSGIAAAPVIFKGFELLLRYIASLS